MPYEEDPKTLGGHLKKRRLELDLLQRNVADQLRVSLGSYVHWGNGKITPGVGLYRRIVEFLGYYPHPTQRTLGHRLIKICRCLGLTSRQAGQLADVDQGTFLMWGRGWWTPTVRTRAKVDEFLERFEQDLPAGYPPVPSLG